MLSRIFGSPSGSEPKLETAVHCHSCDRIAESADHASVSQHDSIDATVELAAMAATSSSRDIAAEIAAEFRLECERPRELFAADDQQLLLSFVGEKFR